MSNRVRYALLALPNALAKIERIQDEAAACGRWCGSQSDPSHASQAGDTDGELSVLVVLAASVDVPCLPSTEGATLVAGGWSYGCSQREIHD